MTADIPAFDELAALRALIAQAAAFRAASDADTEALAAAAVEHLSGHRWRDEEHRVVYHSLRAALRHTAIPIRQQMAAEATRMGHPDVDWSLYF